MQPVRKGRKWSTRGSVPSFDSDSLQQLAFPDDSGANDSGPAKEDTSHVARRRLPSEPAHEVDVDDVELLDERPAAIVRAFPREDVRLDDPRLEDDGRDSGSDIVIDDYILDSIPEAPKEPVRETSAPRESAEPSSLAPLSMSADAAKAPFDLPLAPPGEIRPRRPRSFGMLIACALVATLIAGGLVVRRGTHEAAVSLGVASMPETKLDVSPRPEPVAAAEPPPLQANAEPVAAPSPTPLPPPPHPTTGKIVGLSDHRLWVDGALVTGFEATVRCGKHQVQVGSAGAVRTVDVPCGDAVKALP